jgi:hypothetical protein
MTARWLSKFCTQNYLALRGDAEPGLQPEVRRVREELEAVERESADR